MHRVDNLNSKNHFGCSIYSWSPNYFLTYTVLTISYDEKKPCFPKTNKMNLPQPFSTVATKVIGFTIYALEIIGKIIYTVTLFHYYVGIYFENLRDPANFDLYKTSLVLFPFYLYSH